MAGEQEETVKAQVCKDMGCEDRHDARGCEVTTPNFPDLSPAVLKGTWKDSILRALRVQPAISFPP